MQAYIIRRLLLIIPTFVLVTLIIFLLLRFVPGSVVDIMVGEMGEAGKGIATEEMNVEKVRSRLGLDVPVHIQYGRWLGILPHPEAGFSGLLQGNLGKSFWTQMPILPELLQKIPVSLELGVLAKVIALAIALPIGTLSAIRQDTVQDYAGRSIAILSICLPSFWLGTMVIIYPAIWWQWTPPLTYIPFVQDPSGNLKQFLLPAIILGMVTSGTTMRMTRTMMLEVLRQDYIRTAWAKGLTERVVVLRHVLKNALIPVVTIVGMQLTVLISGSVVLEQIFALPGVGRYMVEAINRRDYPVISAINVFVASFVLIMNLVVDMTYGFLDPRVQYK